MGVIDNTLFFFSKLRVLREEHIVCKFSKNVQHLKFLCVRNIVTDIKIIL